MALKVIISETSRKAETLRYFFSSAVVYDDRRRKHAWARRVNTGGEAGQLLPTNDNTI